MASETLRDPPPIGTADYVRALEDRIDDLARRLDGRGKTRRERVAEWSGFVGGVLSIAIALFTLWDQSVGREQAEQKAIAAQLAELTSKIQGVNQQIQAVAYSGQDAITKQTQMTALGAQKTPLVEQGADLVAKLKQPATAATYVLLAVELANLGNAGDARRLADRAVTAPGSDYLHSEALRMRGTMRVAMEGPSALPAARGDFRAALRILARYPAQSRGGSMTNVYGSWIAAETSAASCAPVDGLLRRFVVENSSPAINRMQRDMAFGTLRWMLDAQTNCPWNPALLPPVAPPAGIAPSPATPLAPPPIGP